MCETGFLSFVPRPPRRCQVLSLIKRSLSDTLLVVNSKDRRAAVHTVKHPLHHWNKNCKLKKISLIFFTINSLFNPSRLSTIVTHCGRKQCNLEIVSHLILTDKPSFYNLTLPRHDQKFSSVKTSTVQLRTMNHMSGSYSRPVTSMSVVGPGFTAREENLIYPDWPRMNERRLVFNLSEYNLYQFTCLRCLSWPLVAPYQYQFKTTKNMFHKSDIENKHL